MALAGIAKVEMVMADLLSTWARDHLAIAN
jgi:hypothetical protein